jgi:hypothetical protein
LCWRSHYTKSIWDRGAGMRRSICPWLHGEGCATAKLIGARPGLRLFGQPRRVATFDYSKPETCIPEAMDRFLRQPRMSAAAFRARSSYFRTLKNSADSRRRG